MAKDKKDDKYGIAVAFTFLIWSALFAYSPTYFGFADHWGAWIMYGLAGVSALIWLGGFLAEMSRLLSDKRIKLNDNLIVAIGIGGIAVLFHVVATWAPWTWLSTILKVIVVFFAMIAATGFAYSTEDAIRATITREVAPLRRRIWNGVKALAAFLVGLLSAAVAATQLIGAFNV